VTVSQTRNGKQYCGTVPFCFGSSLGFQKFFNLNPLALDVFLVAEKILVPVSVTFVFGLSLFVLHHNYLSMCSLGKICVPTAGTWIHGDGFWGGGVRGEEHNSYVALKNCC
jgi:hypothetical protein